MNSIVCLIKVFLNLKKKKHFEKIEPLGLTSSSLSFNISVGDNHHSPLCFHKKL